MPMLGIGFGTTSGSMKNWSIKLKEIRASQRGLFGTLAQVTIFPFGVDLGDTGEQARVGNYETRPGPPAPNNQYKINIKTRIPSRPYPRLPYRV
jgi:hypothetical protein